MIDFWPPPTARFANMLLGGVAVVVGVYLSVDEPSLWTVGLVICVIGVVTMVRGYRVGVSVDDQEVVVRGLFKSRSIPRTAIIDVVDRRPAPWFFNAPAVAWQSKRGTLRHTPISAFQSSYRAGEGLRKYNDDMLEKIRHAMRSAPCRTWTSPVI